MNIACTQMKVIPGRPDLNTITMKQMIEKAKNSGAQMIIFPELCLSGFFLGDTWEHLSFLKDCVHWGKEIIAFSQNICIVFGNIALDPKNPFHDYPSRIFNACFVAYQGRLWGDDNFPYPWRIKSIPPGSRKDHEHHHFLSLEQFAGEMKLQPDKMHQPINLTINGNPLSIGCILGDILLESKKIGRQFVTMAENNRLDMLINLACQPYTTGQDNQRQLHLAQIAKKAALPMAYVNCTGMQNSGKTLYAFSGLSTIYQKTGDLVDCQTPYKPGLKIFSLKELQQNEKINIVPKYRVSNDTAEIYQALFHASKEFLATIGMKKVVIGLSGGIDSAISACLYREILGAENLLLVNMPSKYSSETTKGLAAQLAQNLGCPYMVMPIQEAVDLTIKEINHTPITSGDGIKTSYLKVSSFNKENIQARDRSARLLAGLAAAFGGGFTCNSNKSEMTVGYTTLYGDQGGFLAACGDLWKYQIYDLANYFNKQIYKRKVIPQKMIDLVPSAELSGEQNIDAGQGDPFCYPYHDYLFRSFVEAKNPATPEEIIDWYRQNILEDKIGCPPGLVKELFPRVQDFIQDLEYWWQKFSGIAVAKRMQAPPIIAVSPRAFGRDLIETQKGAYFSIQYQQLKAKLLGKEVN